MPRNRGQVVPKGPGRWLIRAYAGRTEAGKRRYVSQEVEGTYRQAEQALTKMYASMDSGTFVEPSKLTLSGYLTGWLKGRSQVLSPKSYRDYDHLIKKNIAPYIGHVALSKLTALDIQRCYGSLLSDRKLSSRTVRYTHAVLSSALSRAVALNVLLRNPAELVELPKRDRQGSAASALTFEETAKFLNHNQQSGDRLHALWRLLLTAGLRPQEALALQWSDIADASVTIRRALVESTPGCWTIGETKTEDSVRRVTLSQETLDALIRHKATYGGGGRTKGAIVGTIGPSQDSVLIFCTKTGHHFDPRNIRRAWKAALANAEVREVRLYDARHTAVSQYLSLTGNPRETADRFGHADPAMTLRVYSHTLPSVAATGPSKVEAALKAAGL